MEGEVTMDPSVQAYRLEEYKQIREEAAARELAINQLFIGQLPQALQSCLLLRHYFSR